MKWTLRNLLFAVPCFGAVFAIHVNHRLWLEAIRTRSISLPSRCLDDGTAALVVVVGLAFLVGYVRTALAMGAVVLITSVLTLTGFLDF